MGEVSRHSLPATPSNFSAQHPGNLGGPSMPYQRLADCPRSRLSGAKRKSFAPSEITDCDPLQKWGRGERYPYAEHRSNMNVINISAKKAETRSGANTVP